MPVPQPFRYYRFADVELYIGGKRIQEYGEDGEISFEYSNDLVEQTKGADGVPVYSENAGGTMTCTLTVSQLGLGYKQLAALIQAQINAPAGGLAVPFLLRNPAQGDLVASPWCVFLNRTPLTLSRMAGTAEFRMSLPYAGITAQFGVNN